MRRSNITALHELLEFGFLGEVVGNGDDHDDDDGDKDGHAIDPANGEAIVVDADRSGHDGGDAEDPGRTLYEPGRFLSARS